MRSKNYLSVCLGWSAFSLLSLLLVLSVLWSTTLVAGVRYSMDFDWRFHLGEVNDAENPYYPDHDWRKLNVPHDWSIELSPDPKLPGANGFLPGGTGWYRKQFIVPDQWRGQKLFIDFDGVYMNSEVYLNGHPLGRRPYGYVSFQYELTPATEFGTTNVLAVHVNHADAPTSRWYSGSGIYRHVWLETVDPLHLAHWGTYVTTPRVSSRMAEVQVCTTIENQSDARQPVELQTEIVNDRGNVVASAISRHDLGTATNRVFSQSFKITSPDLWSPASPRLYHVRSLVKSSGRATDSGETCFGVRSIQFSSNGFFLNGEKVKLKGVCIHQNSGSLGAAVPLPIWESRLEALKLIGCNALRMSHNPPAPELLDLCDRLGFLVLDEAFDQWKSGYYKVYFDDWWQQDLDAMVLRDRNHPCVMLWSVGNEVAEQGKPEGARILKLLVDHVHQVDPSRKVTYAARPDRGPDSSMNAHGFYQPLDVVGYNYQEPWYESDHQQFPNRVMLATESFPCFSGSTTNIFNCLPVSPWWAVQNHDYVVGQFLWVGIDYLGESQGWPSRGWPGCLLDDCGWPKPLAGFYRSVWGTTPAVQIMVRDDTLDINEPLRAWSWPHLAQHWNFTNFHDRVIQVETPSNCEKVELLLNGKSLGVRRPADYPNRIVLWNLNYQPGELHAVGYNGNRTVCSDDLRTAGPPTRLELSPDHQTIAADGEDVCCIEGRLVDRQGVLVPNADTRVSFEIEGPAKIIGVDNGDLRLLEPIQPNARPTYGGKVMAVVQSLRASGEIHLIAHAAGLPEASISIQSLSATIPAI